MFFWGSTHNETQLNRTKQIQTDPNRAKQNRADPSKVKLGEDKEDRKADALS